MKKIIIFIIRIVLSLALIYFLLAKIDLSTTWTAVKESNLKLLILSFVLFCFILYLSLYRWDILLQGLRLRFKFFRLLVSFSGGLFFNLFLPTTMGGDVIKGLHLAAYSKRTREVVTSVIIDRLAGYLALSIVALVSLIIGFSYLKDRVVLSAVSVLTCCLVIALIALFNKKAYRFTNRFLRKGKFSRTLRNIHREMFYLQARPKVLAKILVISLVVQIGSGFTYFLVAYSLGVYKPIIYFLILVPVISAFATLPLTIGGLGLRDVGTVFLFAKIGISKEVAIVISLINFLFIIITGIIGGVIYVFGLHPRWLQHHKTHPAARYQKTKR